VWFGETPYVMIADSELIQETVKRESLAYGGRFFFNDHYNNFERKFPLIN
jgi:hypothetical protein